jgi:hypothetical protein
LWWQHEQFPKVWTAEGLSTCSENGYQWTINSTMWNLLRVQWQGQPLDLLRRIHEEVHLQNTLEASGYRSPTWRILRALQFTRNGNPDGFGYTYLYKLVLQTLALTTFELPLSRNYTSVKVGESTITAAPFFEGAGRPSKPYWGPQQGRRVILWESLSPESQQRCHQPLALVTCLPPKLPSWLSLTWVTFARLPSKMHFPYSRNACVALSFGLALHHITHSSSF